MGSGVHAAVLTFISLLLAALALVAPAPAQAQTPPDAGALRQQIERDRAPELPPRTEALKPADTARPALPQGGTVTVQAFRFSGNSLMDEARLQAAVQGWLARPVGLADLQQAAQAVAATFREAGWIVRAFVPAQDVSAGTVTIQIVEASFAGARLEEPLPQQVSAATVLAPVLAAQAVGKPLNADALDRALLLADDLPGVVVSGALAPGQRDGETALVLSARDEPLITGEAGVDNAGARSTGAERLTLAVRANSPLGRGDQVRADLMAARGTRYGQVAYSLPVGAKGLRVGASASIFDYELVGSEFAALGAEGGASSVGADARYPLLRSRLANLYLNGAIEHKRYRNRANGSVQSQYRSDALTVGLAGNRFDAQGGGASSGSLSWTQGRLSLGDINPGENTARAGSYGRLRYSATHQQPLTRQLALVASVSGQHANKDLDSSERFYLGGPNGVRAYPVNEGGGSRGTLLNLELRWRALPAVTATAFYDWGSASHVGNASPTAAKSPDTTLKGYGAAVSWAAPGGVEVRAVLATRDGRNPNPTLTGKDQDGSLKRTRLWLQAGFAF